MLLFASGVALGHRLSLRLAPYPPVNSTGKCVNLYRLAQLVVRKWSVAQGNLVVLVDACRSGHNLVVAQPAQLIVQQYVLLLCAVSH